ncbi:MAG: proteasome subunit alpha [Bifidobacteriaceae bacterium]|jgi:proteasome alpha subunit|nr:proteasome subunit alpha [Bifidobacteriaceae bacterium]
MTLPLYVPPEQIIKDRADFAKRGVARGRPAVVVSAADGVLLAAANASRALKKLSEIYDRLAFAAVGKWSEFEALRVAGIRYADLRGYSYDRVDVTARGLAGAYAQSIAAAFTGDPKPLEVELAVAEVGPVQASDAVFHVRFDGSVSDELPWAVLGGARPAGRQAMAEGWRPGLSLAEAAGLARAALAEDGLSEDGHEVGLLRRNVPGRAFIRLGSLTAAQFEKPVAQG